MDAAAGALAVIETDAVVIGAGPVGLFQVFELGLQELRAHVIDVLPAPGGQCTALYADKPIYDIPGLPVCSAQELIDRLLQQIAPFAPVFHHQQLVASLEPQADGRFRVGTSAGTHLLARVIVIAAGVGAFQPRGLKVAGLDAFEGTQLFHHADAALLAGATGRVVVVGGDEAAVAAALALSAPAARAVDPTRHVTLLHRRSVLQAPPAQLDAFHARCAEGALDFRVGQVSGAEQVGDRLSALEVTGVDGDVALLPADRVHVLLGMSPKLGPIADWGLAMAQRQLQVDTAGFTTSVAGIHAVGDVCSYPGKRRLIVSGFHEAALAAFAAAAHIRPGQKVPLEYTTASPRLHRLLGVADSAQH